MLMAMIVMKDRNSKVGSSSMKRNLKHGIVEQNNSKSEIIIMRIENNKRDTVISTNKNSRNNYSRYSAKHYNPTNNS